MTPDGDRIVPGRSLPGPSKRGQVSPFIVMDVMQAAAEREAAGKEVLHLEVGQPATPAPAGVLRAARHALVEDRIGYTVALGIAPLREAISAHYRREYGTAVDPADIMVTTGSSAGFHLSFLASFEAGARVALASPGYPAYRNILSALDIEPVLLEVGPETRFQPTPDLLAEIPGRLDGLIVASPANPTGTMLGAEELTSLAEYCASNGVRLISDEIYHGIAYEAPAATAAGLPGGPVVINSFSKYFSMTGWRLGWMVMPPDLRRSIECLAQNFFISAPTLSQIAGVAAFDCGEELDRNVQRYAANRAVLLERLPLSGLDRLAPADGAFYIYAELPAIDLDSPALCRRMLDELGIAATPGVDFDPGRGHRWLRFSFAGSTEDMAEAARRLEDWLPRL